MDSQHTAVEINTVSHTYGKTVALDNISLNILQGSTVGLINVVVSYCRGQGHSKWLRASIR